MKKLLMVLGIVLIGVLGFVAGNYLLDGKVAFYDQEDGISSEDAQAAFDLLNSSLDQARFTYFEYLKTHEMKTGQENIEALLAQADSEAYLNYEDQSQFSFDVEKDGYYELYLQYEMKDTVMNNGTVALTIDGQLPFYEANFIDLPLLWQDKSKTFDLDSYGDEALPQQVVVGGVLNVPLYNNTYISADPLLFYLEAGNRVLTLTNQSSSPFKMIGVTAKAPRALLSYDEYKKAAGGNADVLDADYGTEKFTVNATDYIMKNSSYVRLMSLEDPSVTPFDPVDKKLNVISGLSWDDPGKNITYEMTVEESGWYKLGVHYMPHKDDYHVFRTLRIDGDIPFEEVKAYPFKDVNGDKLNYEILQDEEGKAYEFYLTQGSHTITFTADYEPISYDLRRIQLIIDHINQFALDIRKITGKEVDKNRTWKLTDYIPETESYLLAYDTLIKDIIEESGQYAPNGVASSTLSYLQKALAKLDLMLEDPDELPLYFEDLYSGSGSVNQMLGDTMETMKAQPLSLSEFTFFQGDLDKKANAGILASSAASIEKFVSSFTSDKYVVRNDEKMLNVWVNRPITHVDTLQKLVDSEFTAETGIEVKISVMPDANKLVLASAAGEAPDVAMGLLSYMPFDLAIRGAAYDLSSFDDFWTVADRFTPGAFVPYVLEDNVYALPETLEFFTTVYRKDIFQSLGFEVPNTWDEVTELLPELQRYGMNFYHPIAGGTSLKWFYQTSPFIYQKGGSLYSEDGLRSTIDETEAVEGLEYLSKLFTMYSLPEQEPLFYNAFRYGTEPIGIADFTTYMQIKNAAPELVGQWELAPYPGMIDSEGNLNRWIIANGRGSVIMKDSDKADEAWEFLKWWTSEEVQTTYSYTLQSIYGPEYLWLSGNLAAVENSPIDIQDKVVILEQIKWLRDVPRTPGQYMLERGVSDIWNTSVFDHVPTRIAIDKQVITINREIRRKMIEFGYLDEEGNVLVPYPVRDIEWIIEQIEEKGEANE